MKNNNNILTQGTVLERHSAEVYRVKLQNGQILLCWMTARFRVFRAGKKKRPKIVIGDKVKVEISPRDFSKGMLVQFA